MQYNTLPDNYSAELKQPVFDHKYRCDYIDILKGFLII